MFIFGFHNVIVKENSSESTMCSMDKCNINPKLKQKPTSSTVSFQDSKRNKQIGKRTDNTGDLDKIISLVRRKYYEKHNIIPRDVEYKERDANGIHYVCHIDLLYLIRVDNKAFAQRIQHVDKYLSHVHRKIEVVDGCKILFLDFKQQHRKFEPQIIGLSAISDSINALTSVISSLSSGYSCLKSGQWKHILADVTALLLHIREGFLSVPKLFACILQLYSLDSRVRHMSGQSSSTDLLTLLGVAGFPKSILDALKSFTMLTGKKIFDGDFVMSCFSSAVTLIRSVLSYMSEKESTLAGTNITGFITKFFDFMTSSVDQYNRIKAIINLYTRAMKNPGECHNSIFRTDVIKLYEECVADPLFSDYISNASNKDFRITWNAFVESVYKVCKYYGISKRKEPVAVVFQGLAGSGKTTLMNTYVDYLFHHNKSVYVHTVPAVESEKDFYDDYKNQDVFVMDDVGQQGISQWRTLINFVSTTVFPLNCAKAEWKNTKSFNSSLILATTNKFEHLTGMTKADCISEPDALFRRPHLINVEGKKDANGHFYQVLTYKKYDYSAARPKWVRGFIHHWSTNDINPVFDSSYYPPSKRNLAVIKWLSTVVEHIQRTTEQENLKVSINKDDIHLVDEFDLFYDASNNQMDNHSQDVNDVSDYERIKKKTVVRARAQDTSIINTIRSNLLDPAKDHVNLWREWINYYGEQTQKLVKGLVSWCAEAVTQFFSDSGNWSIYKWIPTGDRFVDSIMGGLEVTSLVPLLAITMSVITLCSYYSGGSIETDNLKLFEDACNIAAAKAADPDWRCQSGPLHVESDNSRLESVKRSIRMIVRRDRYDSALDSFSQCVVSGDKILLPAHAWPEKVSVDIYVSLEHYRNNCKEREDLDLTRIRMYPGCDLAIYQINRCLARYPNCNNLFKTATIKNPSLYLVNSYITIPILLGLNCTSNNEIVQYGTYVHKKGSGFFHPLTAGGACGTVLFSEDHGIVGFHVAGGDDIGFCVVPPRNVAEEIRSIVLHREDTQYVFDREIIPDHSGARLRYVDNYITPSRVISESDLIPTVFNADSNPHTQALKQAIVDDVSGNLTTVDTSTIRTKEPPSFTHMGSPRKLLRSLAEKSFKCQGRITESEEEFISECIDTLIPEFYGISDQVCAFGDSDITSLDKDSSNGYGCLKDKREYFNFEDKTILPAAHKLFDEFRSAIENDNVDIRSVLSTECFKDELRTVDKVKSPRTFRVMPLNHIWWTKKIFGDVVQHFKKERMKTGVCVGYNPYVDTAELALKLQQCSVTGDIDFSKWDGSIMARFMYLIGDAFKRKYRGEYGKVLDYIITSMASSCVLIGDELHATTHGLPSGTWLTLLMNCLINKCITALTLYRYKDEPTTTDFSRVVDFVMGDDKVIGSAGDDVKWFNLQTINEVATSLGMTCTNGDKTPIKSHHQPFINLTFVKRHFRQHPILKKYVGVLSVETLLGTIQWMDRKKDPSEVIPGKMRAVQIEAYLHSKALYQAFTSLFLEYYPFEALFTEEQIIAILSRDDAYITTLRLMGKDYKYLL
jgi:hypothetical protein